ncbi:MAG: RNA polymerase factor sigma-54 [Deltaproteobacteria bacterium]|nr:RNA polymerase factor sigma-54 [Deltaproteobacteria bacterium]
MAMEMKQSLRMTQSLVMTPQLQMAIKLLQLNQMELVEAINQEMLENPLLEEKQERANEEAGVEADAAKENPVPPPAEAQPSEVRLDAPDTQERAQKELDIDWERVASDYSYQPTGTGVKIPDEELPGYDQTLTRRETLHDHLAWQLRMSGMNSQELEIGFRIIGDIDPGGYLRTREDEEAAEDALDIIAEEMDVPKSWVENVHQRILRFDPLGVGSRDLRECLMVQLDVGGYDADDLVYRLVADHLKDVEKRAFHAVAKALKVPLEEIGEAVKIIATMEPRPGRNFSSGGEVVEDAQYITPDIAVQKVGDSWAIVLNEDGMPRLRISRFYANQILKQAQRGDPSKAYIQDKLRSATWLIRSIHQRQRTIYKVMESILKHQREFFDKGVNHLKPLILRDVADDIGMHESTVSRVTSNKYVHTPQGIFELKYFFNSTIKGTGAQDDLASEAVKSHIKELIGKENPKKPLSDQQIVNLLKQRDIDIARRTVAKYREMMGILPSSKRKDVFGSPAG